MLFSDNTQTWISDAYIPDTIPRIHKCIVMVIESTALSHHFSITYEPFTYDLP